ncbi:hypothetical protein BL254_00285 [Protofrankia sp. BMG5.30]|uniref:Secreted protein n=1 Tax=Protofrankia coriariae TaxID=1562887 RepID=A0ABR5F4V5_9ACTN|nr:hypothetical protein FrCorBMG51_09485 [Protofrankia coriariae]ONH38356.1 hypothetical protein BL254_00285 [Protofrankia sp. BMG5.30]
MRSPPATGASTCLRFQLTFFTVVRSSGSRPAPWPGRSASVRIITPPVPPVPPVPAALPVPDADEPAADGHRQPTMSRSWVGR